jgi:hypothetical protein
MFCTSIDCQFCQSATYGDGATASKWIVVASTIERDRLTRCFALVDSQGGDGGIHQAEMAIAAISHTAPKRHTDKWSLQSIANVQRLKKSHAASGSSWNDRRPT